MSTTPTTAPQPSQTISGICGSVTLVGKEGYAVKQFTDATWILCSSQGELGYILLQGGAIGAPVLMADANYGEVIVHVSAAQATYGLELTPGTTGKMEVAAASDYVIGRTQELATATGDMIRIRTAQYQKI